MNIICIIKDFYSYLTMWNLTLIFLFYIGYLQKYYYDLLFLSLFISGCSFAFTYIYPQKFTLKINNFKITFKGTKLIILDLISHHIPLLFLLCKYNNYVHNKTYIFILIPLIYTLLLNDHYERYGLKDEYIFIIYFFIFFFYKK